MEHTLDVGFEDRPRRITRTLIVLCIPFILTLFVLFILGLIFGVFQ